MKNRKKKDKKHGWINLGPLIMNSYELSEREKGMRRENYQKTQCVNISQNSS